MNQCEFHPYQNPKELRDFCGEKGIAFQVFYSSLSWQFLLERFNKYYFDLEILLLVRFVHKCHLCHITGLATE